MAGYNKYNGKVDGIMLEEKKNPMSDGLPHQKTDFREASALDHEYKEDTALKATFAYPGTDKGVAK